jgi:integrase
MVIRRLTRWPQQPTSEYVFPGSRGGEPYQGAKRVCRSVFALAGIEDANSHTLRHTFGSIASGLGYSDATIAGLLGHAGRSVTSRYVHRPDAS